MVSGGSSDSSGQGFSSSQNIGTALMANLFGQGAKFGSSGVRFTNTPFGEGSPAEGTSFKFANPVFQPGDFSSLRNILNPTPRTGLQQVAEGIGTGALSNFLGDNAALLPAVSNSAANAGLQALNTGFRTDIAPIVADERRRLFNETLPDIAEQFAGLTGGFSSDFGNAAIGAGKDLGIQLGSLQSQLDESAADRRLRAITEVPSAIGVASTLPFAISQDALSLGQAIQEDIFLSDPGVQLLRNLTNLFTVAPPSTGSTQSQKSESYNFGILA